MMSETMKQTGSCLCGAVSVTANNASTKVGACHCGMCRKWGGGHLWKLIVVQMFHLKERSV